MAGPDPAIHVLLFYRTEDVDARVKPGHDDLFLATPAVPLPSARRCIWSQIGTSIGPDPALTGWS